MFAPNLLNNLLACVTCVGDRGGATNTATTGAVIFMLVMLVGVFGGVFKFMCYLSRCERESIQRGQDS